MRAATVNFLLALVAIVLFVYAGFLVDHGDDFPGNTFVLWSAGFALAVASRIDWPTKTA